MGKCQACVRKISVLILPRYQKVVLIGLNCSLNLMMLLQPSGSAVAQASQPPQDGRSMLTLAARSNSISTVGMNPWHLKATYTLFDDGGRSEAQGTLEEWWRGAHKRRVAYSSSNFSQTDYVTDQGTFRTGAQASSSFPLSLLERQLAEPIAVDEQNNSQPIVETEVVEQNGAKMLCLKETGVVTPQGPRRFSDPYSYCLSPDSQQLAIVESPLPDSIRFTRTRPIPFHGRTIPGDLIVVRNGKTLMTAHVDALDELQEGDEVGFTPGTDARPVGIRVTLSADVIQRMLLEKKKPEYPPDAKAAGISGTVSVQILIGKDGHVSDLYPISGPDELQGAALDAVRGWVFKPYLLGGKAVEASATVYAVFSTGG